MGGVGKNNQIMAVLPQPHVTGLQPKVCGLLVGARSGLLAGARCGLLAVARAPCCSSC